MKCVSWTLHKFASRMLLLGELMFKEKRPVFGYVVVVSGSKGHL